MMGKHLTNQVVADNIALGQIMASGLTLIEQGRVSIAGLSLTVHAGEIVGLVGDPGSGKSRCLALIGGLVEPTFGVLRLRGASFKGIQSSSVAGMNITANGTMIADKWINEFCDGMGLHGEVVRTRVRAVLEYTVLEYLGLEDVGWSELISQRNGRREPCVRSVLGLAAALASDSPVILIDEPTKGLTTELAKRVWKVLRDISDSGKAVLISVDSSDLDSVGCDRLYLIENGVITRRGTLQDIRGSLLSEEMAGGGR
jgi:ABC-type multidrug transport system ATPase subunit